MEMMARNGELCCYISCSAPFICSAFAAASSGCDQADLTSHLLVAQAMSAFSSDRHHSKDILFQAYVSTPLGRRHFCLALSLHTLHSVHLSLAEE